MIVVCAVAVGTVPAMTAVRRDRAAGRAFTLVELIVVIVIVALLAAIGAFAYNRVVENGRKHAARMMAAHVARDASGVSAGRQALVSTLTGDAEMLEATGAAGDAGKSRIVVAWGSPDPVTGAISAGVTYGAYCTPVWWPGRVASGVLGTTVREATCATVDGQVPDGVTGGGGDGSGGDGSGGVGTGGDVVRYGGGVCDEGTFSTPYVTGKVRSPSGYMVDKAVFPHAHTGPGTANYRWYGLARNTTTGATQTFWGSGATYGAPLGDVEQLGPAFSDWPPAGTVLLGMGIYDTARQPSGWLQAGVTDPGTCAFYWGEPLFDDPASDRDVPFGPLS